MADPELVLRRGIGAPTKCRSCPTKIIFATTMTNSKPAPWEEDIAGEWLVVNGEMKHVGKPGAPVTQLELGAKPEAAPVRYTSHFARCPAAERDKYREATLHPRQQDAVELDSLRARLAECERERDEARQQNQHERDHSTMLSESNSALHVEKRAVETYCAKVRGELTAALARAEQAERERDELKVRSQGEAICDAMDLAERTERERIAAWLEDAHYVGPVGQLAAVIRATEKP